jgi:hypothetical protein
MKLEAVGSGDENTALLDVRGAAIPHESFASASHSMPDAHFA